MRTRDSAGNLRTQAGHGTFTMSPSFTRCTGRVLQQLTVLSSRRGDAARPFRERYHVRSPCPWASRPALTKLVSVFNLDVAPRAWPRAPPSPRAGASSNSDPLRAPAVPRTFTMSPSFTPRAHDAHFHAQLRRRLQSVHARYRVRSPCPRASRGPLMRLVSVYSSAAAPRACTRARAPAPVAARQGIQCHFVRRRYYVRSPCPRASPGPLMTFVHCFTSHLSPFRSTG